MKSSIRLLCGVMLLWVAAACQVATKDAPEAAHTHPHDFARWEKEIAAYEMADRENPPPSNAVLFTGSSTIRLWKTLADDFPQHQVINRGFGGSEIIDATHFADRIILPYRPKMVILASGTNDINNGVSAQQVYDDFTSFVAGIHSTLPQTRVVFVSLNPRISRWNQRERNKAANDLIKRFAERTPNVAYIETYDMTITPQGEPRRELFAPDNLHFNAEGYRLLAERIRPYLPK